MKRLLVIALPVIILFLISTGSAFANAGPHGGYSADPLTAACAGCHRAHTAVGENLLKRPTVYELCMSCHGNGTVSTNVRIGRNVTTLVRLNGGGFEQVGNDGILQNATSAHTLDGMPGSVPGVKETGVAKAWGSDGGDGTGVQGILECTSCHNPHGSSNYRLLRDSNNSDWGTPVPGADKWVANNPDILDWTDKDLAPNPSSPRAVLAGMDFTAYETVDALGMIRLADGSSVYGTRYGNYTMGMIRFCATCHKQYWTFSGSGHTASSEAASYAFPGMQTWAGDADGNTYRYRHAVSMAYTSATSLSLRFAAATWMPEDPDNPLLTRQGMTCLTCHFAHGTSATVTSYSTQVPSGDSALLYYPERGVCRACHQQNK